MKANDLGVVGRAMARVLGPKLVALEQRVTALEQRPEVRWSGVWQQGQAYGSGQLVTRSGSLWLATADTVRQPGEGASEWKLIVKNGTYRQA